MTISIDTPRFEHHDDALGIGEPAPRVSWVTTAPAAWTPAAYELEVERDGTTTSSGRIPSSDSVLVPWPGEPLRSRESARVRVRVWGEGDAEPSAWSPVAAVEAGLLERGDWTAVPIRADWGEYDVRTRRPSILRREFDLPAGVVAARLYVSAHGVYEAEINGVRVGDEALAPGWTPYDMRLIYATHDVAALLAPGANVIGARLADGWYRGRYGPMTPTRYDNYGTDLSLIAQLEVELASGERVVVATGSGWRAGRGGITFSSLYDGEHFDAREEPVGWSSPGFDASGWDDVLGSRGDAGVLHAPIGPPVRATTEFAPRSIERSPSGKTVVDFGQNFSGRLRIAVSGPAGTVVRFRHGEVLEDGEVSTRQLGTAEATDVYTLAGTGREEWEPRFTIHGFRYVEVDGWPGEIGAGDLVGVAYHSDMRKTGSFAASDPRLTQLHSNIEWSTRGNFVSIPTDCPQRHERLGWTGDAQLFAPTASFVFDTAGFLSSWLVDVALDQRDDGVVPWFVPAFGGKNGLRNYSATALWGDVATFTPWTVYERSGDVGVLARQFESARRWVDKIESISGDDLISNPEFQYGDWLDPAAPPEKPEDALTPSSFVSAAYFARSARIVADMAAVLGRSAEAARYGALADAIRASFRDRYVRDGGLLTVETQTGYSLAIRFGILDDAELATAGAALAKLVTDNGFRIGVGLAGINLVLDALESTGHLDAAYGLLMEEECPSWLYAVAKGATTMWERWDSLLPDGTLNPGPMNSFNHYWIGVVGDWLHRTVAGLAPAEPGYRRILFRPRPGGGLTSAQTAHRTPYGDASIAWRLEGGELVVAVEVPTGTTAVVDLPDGTVTEVGPGAHELRSAA